MKNMKILFSLIAGCILLFSFEKSSSATMVSVASHLEAIKGASTTVNPSLKVTVPQKAYDVADYVATHGTPPRGYVGGSVFSNYEGLLPDGVSYKEYDVNPKIKGQNRGAERIVLGDDGSRYYTNDHYRSFTAF